MEAATSAGAGCRRRRKCGSAEPSASERATADTRPLNTKKTLHRSSSGLRTSAHTAHLRSLAPASAAAAHETRVLKSFSLAVSRESGATVPWKRSSAPQRSRRMDGHPSWRLGRASSNEDSSPCELLHRHAHANCDVTRQRILRRDFSAATAAPPSREGESSSPALRWDPASACSSSCCCSSLLRPSPRRLPCACCSSRLHWSTESVEAGLPPHGRGPWVWSTPAPVCFSRSYFTPLVGSETSAPNGRPQHPSCSSSSRTPSAPHPPRDAQHSSKRGPPPPPTRSPLHFQEKDPLLSPARDPAPPPAGDPAPPPAGNLLLSSQSKALAHLWRCVFSFFLALVALGRSAFVCRVSKRLTHYGGPPSTQALWRACTRGPRLPADSTQQPCWRGRALGRCRGRWLEGAALLTAVLCVCTPSPAAANSPPRFVVAGGAEIVVNLREGPSTPVGTVVTQLQATDPDGDDLTFGVQGEEGRSLLLVEKTGPTTATVSLKALLDREERGEYALVLTLTDGRLGDGTYVTQSLLLLVEDVNDNEPVFLPYEAALLVGENSPPRVLASLRAMDSDEGPYGQVVYALADDGGDTEAFSVTTAGGEAVLRLTGRLDYETQNVYQLKVLARDRAPAGDRNTGTAAVVVRVQDVEDQPPEFVRAPPVTRIPEDIAVNAGVLQVRAVDGDRGVDNKIAYSLLGGHDGFFGLDPDSGVLYVARPLDRERAGASGETFFILIQAEEVTSVVVPAPTAVTEVTVVLQDVNDQTPAFRASHYVAEVAEGAQFNTPLHFIGDALPQVYDMDQGINGTFSLSVESAGAAGELFDVTPHEGINLASFLLRVREPSLLDYERLQVLNLTLVARELTPHSPKSSSCLVTVHLRDSNDNVPLFDTELYEVRVPEDTPPGSVVARVVATDADSGLLGQEGLRYTQLRGPHAHRLALDALTGEVQLREGAELDREEVDELFLTVEVRDSEGRGNRNTATLHIRVDDVNDNAPAFVQPLYEVSVAENAAPVGEPLVVVVARDLDMNGTANQEVRYAVVGGDPLGNFSLGAASGALSLTAPLDFESIKPAAHLRFFNLTIEARDGGTPPLSSLCNVVVYVTDVNDHGPVFEQETYSAAVPEDTPGGTSVLHVRALDGDGSEQLSAVVYRIQRGAEDKFVIDAETGAISVARGAVLDPDRTQPRTTAYVLDVLALDGGMGASRRSAVAQVNISVMDVNNKPPVFFHTPAVRVSEAAAAGSFVARVAAADTDDDSDLVYSLDRNASSARSEEGALVRASAHDFTSAFEVGEADGVVRLVRALDREAVASVRLVVLCQDQNTQQGPRSASTTLTVLVDDTNDNDPQFRRPRYLRAVPENAPPGTAVVTVVADDVDSNKTVSYSWQGGQNVSELLHLDPHTGEVTVAANIDREMQDWLNASVVATDSGLPPRTAAVPLCIQVLDENDNAPQFRSPPSRVVVREDAPPGTTVVTMNAIDPDSGDYGAVTYLLDPKSSEGVFQVNPDGGELTVAGPLDRETTSRYSLVVEAWDNYRRGGLAADSRSVFTQVIVDIADVNDEVPVFEPRTSCSAVTELHPAGDTVTVVRASDADDPRGNNAKISFNISAGNELDLFEIVPIDFSSARLVSTASLVGLYRNYTLTVAAADQGSPPNVALTEVRVCVSDYNDHAPRFVSPDANLTLRVPENATVGSLVIQVRAADDDEGPNGAVGYRLLRDSAARQPTFGIDSVTGAISLLAPLDREIQKLYELRVEAYDHGTPTALKSDLDLTVYVRNVDDHLPTFASRRLVLNFTENSAPGLESAVIPDTVDEDDLDLEDAVAAAVCYYLVRGNELGLFALDRTTHLLTVVTPLDREAQPRHQLWVRATEDCLTPPPALASEDHADKTLLQVVVNVNDENDNAPKFSRAAFTGGISTETAFGSRVLQLTAVDPDWGANAELSYSLVGGVQSTVSEGLGRLRQEPFLVDTTTGAVSLNFVPLRGMKGYFDFEVRVTDGSGGGDSARVFIYLLRHDQRVRFVLRLATDEMRPRVDYLRDYLSNVTGAVVNVDEFRVHETPNGAVDQTKTDLYLHFVDPADNSVLDAPHVLATLDSNVHRLDHLFKELNVLDTSQAGVAGMAVAGVSPDGHLLMVWLVGVVAFLALLLVVTLSLCVAQRAHYARQLRAATATAFGSSESALNRNSAVPNTNLHSVEGSNPVWLNGGFDNEWYKEEESLRYQAFVEHSEANDSIDQNAVDSLGRPPPPDATDQRHHDLYPRPPDLAPPPSRESSSSTVASTARLAAHDPPSPPCQAEQPHLYDTYRSNLQHTFKKLANPLLDKKLETTEL